MKTHHGKIASLPQNIRLQLNQRLEANEDGGAILDWLDGLAEVQACLDLQWDGESISKQNLSDWRLGEYQAWSARKDLWQNAAMMEEVSEARQIQLVDNAAADLAARYAELLVQMDRMDEESLERRVKCLVQMTRGITLLQKSLHGTSESRQKQELARQKETERRTEKARGQKLEEAQNFHLIGVKAALYQELYQCDDKCAGLMACYIHALQHGLPGAERDLAEFNRLYKPVKEGQTSQNEQGEVNGVEGKEKLHPSATVKAGQASPSEQKK